MTMIASILKFDRGRIRRRARDEEQVLSDLELLARVQRRSRTALAVLYERYSTKALGLAYKILRDRDLAEEVVIEAFWRVWQRAGQFQGGRGSFAAWFYGIVRHLAVDELRRRDARPIASQDDQLEWALAASQENDVDEIVNRRLTAATIQHALETLPPAQREVLWLAYWGGLTRDEISKKLGQPLGTVHTRARLGLDKLRVLLAATQT